MMEGEGGKWWIFGSDGWMDGLIGRSGATHEMLVSGFWAMIPARDPSPSSFTCVGLNLFLGDFYFYSRSWSADHFRHVGRGRVARAVPSGALGERRRRHAASKVGRRQILVVAPAMNRRALHLAVIFSLIGGSGCCPAVGFRRARDFQFGQNERLPTPVAQRRREGRRETHLRLLLLLRLESGRMLGDWRRRRRRAQQFQLERRLRIAGRETVVARQVVVKLLLLLSDGRYQSRSQARRRRHLRRRKLHHHVHRWRRRRCSFAALGRLDYNSAQRQNQLVPDRTGFRGARLHCANRPLIFLFFNGIRVRLLPSAAYSSFWLTQQYNIRSTIHESRLESCSNSVSGYLSEGAGGIDYLLRETLIDDGIKLGGGHERWS